MKVLTGRLKPFLGLIAVVVVSIIMSPEARDGSSIFMDPGNISDMLRQVSEIGIIALAMTFVILMAGIDLSVGSVLALSASVTALVLTRWDPGMGAVAHISIAIFLALLASTAVGVLNGLVIAHMRIQPFIVTLAAMLGVRGLAKWLTQNTNIDIGFGEDVSAVFADFTSQKIVVIGTFLILACIFSFLLSRTVFGRHARAFGDNPLAARYSGLPVKAIQIKVYGLCGLMAGLAGVIHCAQTHQGSPNAGMSYELEAIAAVAIGGTSLAGGKGTILGTVIGTLIMGVLTNILGLKNIDSNVQMMIMACIIIFAVSLQRNKETT